MTARTGASLTPIQLNGINAATGGYGLTLSLADLTQSIMGGGRVAAPPKPSQTGTTVRETAQGVNGADLAQAGWGIVFAHADPQVAAIQEALQPLIQLRQGQSGKLFRRFIGADAYRPGESKLNFLERHGVGLGPVDPTKGVPYYLLLVGGPQLIPFEVQYQLDVQFAVGRIHFDKLEEYAAYAQGVVAAETGLISLPRRAAFWSVTNPDDNATRLSTQQLVQPLYSHVHAKYAVRTMDPPPTSWRIDLASGEKSTRTQLARWLGGDQTPAFLFTASHGMEFPQGDPRQLSQQGALLCQDWPGPQKWRGPIPEEFYLAGDHLASNAQVSGLISFHFACFGAGTPQMDDFARQAFQPPQQLAAQPFLAHLPQRLLSRGALAVVSHVDRAWSYSFQWRHATDQTTAFQSTLERLLKGKPLGWSLEYMNQRYAEFSTALNDALDRAEQGTPPDPYDLAGLWTAHHDARNYIIIGDPAVRLALEGSPKQPVTSPAPLSLPPRMGGISSPTPSKPLASLSDSDWQQTPPAVQQALIQAVELIGQLKTTLNSFPT
jgi:hypothetical protein